MKNKSILLDIIIKGERKNMTIQLTDKDIGLLMRELKVLPEDFHDSIRLKSKRAHKEYEYGVTGAEGNTFLLKFRQNEINALDFSVILLYLPKGSSQHFRLRRYNGKSHEHTNKIERECFYDFHIHTATERYQQLGTNEDAYAEKTNRYASFQGATECMLKDCGFAISTMNASLAQWGM
jgi:hypothetical protein